MRSDGSPLELAERDNAAADRSEVPGSNRGWVKHILIQVLCAQSVQANARIASSNRPRLPAFASLCMLLTDHFCIPTSSLCVAVEMSGFLRIREASRSILDTEVVCPEGFKGFPQILVNAGKVQS
jgi:hypothetical protein